MHCNSSKLNSLQQPWLNSPQASWLPNRRSSPPVPVLQPARPPTGQDRDLSPWMRIPPSLRQTSNARESLVKSYRLQVGRSRRNNSISKMQRRSKRRKCNSNSKRKLPKRELQRCWSKQELQGSRKMTTSRSMGMLPIFGSSFPYPPCLLSSLGDNIMCLLGFWPRSNINWAEEGEGFRLATSLKPVVSKSKTRIIFELASHRLSCWFAKMISNIGLRLFSHLTRVSNGNKQSSNLKVASCANAQRDRALRAVAMQTNASDSGVQCWKTLAGNRLQWPGRDRKSVV